MDKFNDIWKNRFNEGDLPAGDWNMPDSEVWEHILPHVPVKKERDKRWILLLGLLLLTLLIWAYFSFANITTNGPVSTLENKQNYTEASLDLMALQEDSKAEASGTKKIDKTSDFDNVLVLTEEQDNGDIANSFVAGFEEVIVENQARKVNMAPLHSTKEPFNKQRLSPDLKMLNSDDEINFENKNTIITEEYNSIDQVIKSSKSLLQEELVLLPSRIFKIEKSQAINPLPNGVEVAIEPTLKPGKLKLYAHTGAVRWQHKISEQYQTDLAPFDFNYSDNTGWYAALEAQVSINKYLDLFAGIQYEQIATTSGHNSSLEYNVAAEENGSSNDYNLSLATPYGLSEASFRFDRNEQLSDDAVDLLVDFHSEHTIQNLNIPVGVKIYPLGKKQRWIPSATFGLGTNYLMKISNNIQSIDTHHDAIQYTRDGASNFQGPDLNEWFFDMRIGLGLGYHLTRDIQLNLYLDWNKGLNPVFQQDSYQTNINRYHLSLGLTKSFLR